MSLSMKKLILKMTDDKYEQLMEAFRYNTEAHVEADIEPVQSFEVQIYPPIGSDILIKKGNEYLRIELDDLYWE